MGFCARETFKRRGLPTDYLWRLHKNDKLLKVGRGMYAIPSVNLTEHQTLIQVAQRVPHGVVCLLSALRFHDLTIQSPFEVWMAIDRKARLPKEEIIPLPYCAFFRQSTHRRR